MKQSVQLGVAHVILVLLHLALQQHALSALLPECGLQLRQVRALSRFCQSKLGYYRDRVLTR
jgi:hypothetical protein